MAHTLPDCPRWPRYIQMIPEIEVYKYRPPVFYKKMAKKANAFIMACRVKEKEDTKAVANAGAKAKCKSGSKDNAKYENVCQLVDRNLAVPHKLWFVGHRQLKNRRN